MTTDLEVRAAELRRRRDEKVRERNNTFGAGLKAARQVGIDRLDEQIAELNERIVEKTVAEWNEGGW